MEKHGLTRKIATIQSNYIPWKGYFDIINHVDEFILYDDVQFTKNDWRNRNKIKTPQGAQWLTIPVKSEGGLHKLIKDTLAANDHWKIKHRDTLQMNYARAKYYREFSGWLDDLYIDAPSGSISDINYHFISRISKVLDIQTPITWVMDYGLTETDKNMRLIELCQKTHAEVYVSGPAASSYLNISLFADHGIKVEYFDYSGYLEYPQLFPPFDHYVSALDLVLNTGKESAKYFKRLPA